MSPSPEISYRSETVGSLLRPDYLKEAVARYEAGALTADALAAVQDRAVLEAIALQEACDLDVLTVGVNWRPKRNIAIKLDYGFRHNRFAKEGDHLEIGAGFIF